jgi:hypothetical protein
MNHLGSQPYKNNRGKLSYFRSDHQIQIETLSLHSLKILIMIEIQIRIRRTTVVILQRQEEAISFDKIIQIVRNYKKCLETCRPRCFKG